jgi:4-amino-4-deoxy-L-arabinose transferase-like glycosyltransferase
MNRGRLWLALVLALFCLPLFVGLGRGDVQDDEAIYSFGVDRLLESGDWLAPKSSPHEDAAFLEKPPLKFWIVAGPIWLGVLPHNEFGLRFWDALFGGIAFLYVFAIGSRLAGPVSGGAAVLLLFVHWPLLFDHGLRSNNMEAALFLCYCGGVFHFLEWARGSRSGWHPVAVALHFVLGFMTKFVAAAFLPVVLAVATLMLPAARSRFAADRRRWMAAGGLAALLIAPWFIYAYLRFGATLWGIILGQHVYDRFTAYLDPAHLQPWYFYPQALYLRLVDAGSLVLVAGGLVLLAAHAVWRRSLDSLVVLLWFLLPVTAISFGTSKLYHYVYPFLPPLALGGGFLAGSVLAVAPVPIGRALRAWTAYSTARLPSLTAVLRRPVVRSLLLAVGGIAVGLAAVTLVFGPVRLDFGPLGTLRNSGVLRPSLVAIVFGVLAGVGHGAGRAVAVLLVAAMLPLPVYRATLARLGTERDPKRAASDCIRFVQAESPGAAPGLYLDLPDRVIGHPLYYYYRRIRPWTRAKSPTPSAIGRYLTDPVERRPVLVWEPTYQEYRRMDRTAASPAMITFTDDVLLLLPGPYEVCAQDGRAASRR